MSEALQLMKDKVMFLIDKSEYHLPQVISLLNQTETKNQALFLFFEREAAVNQMFGNEFSHIRYIPGIHYTTNNIDSYISEFENQISTYAFWIKNESDVVHQKLVDLRVNNYSQNFWINTINQNQCAGHTDAVSLHNPDSGWGWCANQGLNIVMTDYPGKLIQYLKSINKRIIN